MLGGMLMATVKQIYDFAIKWCDKFRDCDINYIELLDHWMADECIALGFNIDCGKAFKEKYGLAIYDPETLNKIIDDITDIPLLGSAIYLRWRYFNHWAYDSAEILNPQNRAWFILALSRLALLCQENQFVFKGTLKKIRIVSNNVCFSCMPEPDDEVEQHLTINNDGQVLFLGYNFGHNGIKHKKIRSKSFKIEKEDVKRLFRAIETYFNREYTEVFATDIGNWVMELTNTEGITYKFYGSLCAEFDYEGTDLSNLIREIVGMNDLYVFDGNAKPDVINKITINYHRVTKIKLDQKPKEVKKDFITWDYSECLIIDRKSGTLEYIQNIGTDSNIAFKYKINDGIVNLLERFDARKLFKHIKGNFEDVIENPNETRDYIITIDYTKSPSRIITGSYDKNGLPEDFLYFVETITNFIKYYNMQEMFNPFVYGKVKRRKSEYIFCSVIFKGGYKSYYYLTDDDSIEIGDLVLVPAGDDDHEVVVEVDNIEYFSKENAPRPIEKTKRIIRKYINDDFAN